MKKVLFVLLLAAATASAQVYPPDASSGTATSVSPSAFPLLAPDGTGAAPSYSFTNNTDMGLRLSGSALIIQSSDIFAPTLGGYINLADNFTYISIRPTDGSDNSVGVTGTDTAYIRTDGTQRWTFGTADLTATVPFLAPDGSTSAPAFSFSGAPKMGMYRASTSLWLQNNEAGSNGLTYALLGNELFRVRTVDVATGNTYGQVRCAQSGDIYCDLETSDGTNVSTVTFNNTGTTFTDPVLLPEGTTAAPALAASGNTDAGMRFDNASELIVLQTATSTSNARLQLYGQAGTGTPYFQLDADDGTKSVQVVGNAWSNLFNITVNDGAGASSSTGFYKDRTEFTDPVLTPQGTSANKAIALSTDPDNGISFQTNTMYIETSTNATQYAHITMDGTGGIGQPSISISANNGSGKTAGITAQAYSPNLSITTNNGTDNSSVSLGPTTVELDADGDNGGNGTITLTVDNDDNQMIMDNTGISFEVEGATPLDLPAESGEVDAHQFGTSTLTDNTATSLLLFALADTEFAYGSITIQTYCEDATDMVGTHEEYDFVCHNDADTEDCAFGVKTGTKPVSGTGTANITTHTLTPSSFRPIAR
jgi:hypothetical protein